MRGTAVCAPVMLTVSHLVFRYSIARRQLSCDGLALTNRMALGAERTRIISLVVRRADRLVLIGIAIGLPAAWLASRSVQSMLFGLERTDPATVGFALLTLMGAALIAACVPSRRASRVDPMVALRHE